MSVKANDPNASFYGLWINGCSGEDAPPCMYDPRWKHMSNARFLGGLYQADLACPWYELIGHEHPSFEHAPNN